VEVEVSATDSRHHRCVGINTYRHCLDYRMSNLERAQNLADAGQYQQSIARSLIVIAAALTLLAEGGRRDDSTNTVFKHKTNTVFKHKDWCEDPTCPTSAYG